MEQTEDIGQEGRKRIKINHYSSQQEEEKEEEGESSSKNKTPENKSKSSESKNETSEESENEKKGESEGENFASLVTAHYNSSKTGFSHRNNSKIYYLRNFNNWIKSVLIKEISMKLEDYSQRNLKVLDMCCGKGGDLFKWAKLKARYIVCTDIAELSLENYKTRYADYIKRCQSNNTYCSLKCEFIPADCTRERLRSKFYDPSIQFDVVSCQFSFHYGFESLPQAECMLKNASECLKRGGYFIGTIPDAYEIVKRLKQAEKKSFGNDVYSIEMCCEEPYPLFGAKYNFYLEGVVNCPEFLVHFPTFQKLAEKFGLELVRKEGFCDFYERHKKTREGEILLKKIKALETYYAKKDTKLLGAYKDYLHAENFCEGNNVEHVGTLSKPEWEVVSLYLTFIFKKI